MNEQKAHTSQPTPGDSSGSEPLEGLDSSVAGQIVQVLIFT